MNNWLTYEAFQQRYPESSLTEAQFTPLAVDALFFIQNATHWTAELADTNTQQELLAECQAQLVQLAEQTDASWDGITSVNNHGYTESYASGMDKQAYFGQQQSRIVYRVLSAPETRWMLYNGGCYRPPRRKGGR